MALKILESVAYLAEILLNLMNLPLEVTIFIKG